MENSNPLPPLLNAENPVKTAVGNKKKRFDLIKILIVSLSIVLLTGFTYGGYRIGINKKQDAAPIQAQAQNPYVSFVFEVYDLINQNYWEKVDEEKLINLFTLASEKIGGQFVDSQPKTKAELKIVFSNVIDKINTNENKTKFVTSVVDAVLSNLQPMGRSRLYSQKDTKQLDNLVQNKNPQINQYDVLGVDKNAAAEAITKIYQEKSAELEKESSPEAKQKLTQIEKAYQTLSDEASRKNYDAAGIETTVEYKLVKPSVLYMKLTRFSPTTFDDIKRVSEKFDTGDVLDTLIFDLRNNIGGAFDGLPYFLGPFIGNNQYAYQLFHRGEKTDYKTKIGWLPGLIRYKKIIILINENSQSTSEVMASVLKKYNVGILLGAKTKGWGTIEKIIPLNNQISESEKYSVLLVHSLSLREDDKPIEGRGIEPTINIADQNWEKQLFSYFNSQEIIETVKQVW